MTIEIIERKEYKEKEFVVCNCTQCDSLLKVSKSSTKESWSKVSGRYWVYTCPVCNYPMSTIPNEAWSPKCE